MDPEPQDECMRCAGPLGWIDEAWVCPSGCTYCADCKDELGGACANCSEMLKRIQRTRQIGRIAPGRRDPPDSSNPGENPPNPGLGRP